MSRTPNGSSSYVSATRERVVVFDGAFGTGIQRLELTADDFGGEALEGCNELLCVTRPEIIKSLHAEYLEVGVDVIETATFGAFSVPLAEYDISERSYEINLAGAQLAKEVAADYSTPDRPRWVAGSIGPGTKFASLGQISFDELSAAYADQCRGLIDGGSDLLIIETMFDLLGVKAAIFGARRAMADCGRELPMQVQVTIETSGRMLPGTEIGAALAAIEPLDPAVIGINCATGPAEMSEHLRHLSAHAQMPISCIPNAGMPQVVDGEMHYDLSAAELSDYHERFITELGVSVIGGCCGTTPEMMAEVVDRCAGLEPKSREPLHEAGATSIYDFVPFDQDVSFLGIGERTNANGSKKFREAMLEEDWDTCVQMAKDQIRDGSHVLDVCVDYVGRDGTTDMAEIASRFATAAAAPLVLDSTEPEVMETGLKWIGGRAILNSANLEDGDAEDSRLDRVMKLAKTYGAAVVCLLIDEEGQARDVEWKMRVAHRLADLAVDRYGLRRSDLIFDALTFPLSTGDDDLRGDAMATIEAIKRIKEEIPGVYTTLGVSNVSFGLKPAARHVLNSVFLAECTKAGLDSAIVHSAKIVPLSRIPDEQLEVCMDLIYDRRRGSYDPDGAYDPLTQLLEVFADVESVKTETEDRSSWSVQDRLSHRIIDGEREGLPEDLDEAMAAGLEPLEIINDVLLSGMKVVGDRFGSGEMQLPFVLQSAETMKAAVAHLEPHMERNETRSAKGSIVLATVKGDVHDIGKNLVDIILSNNGYEVHNLGIKIAISEMIDKVNEVSADVVGMSGLLVKSTLIMRDNLVELNERGLADIPVLLGGAALTRSYVERDLREVYEGRLFYGKDAFEGLSVMERLGEISRGDVTDDAFGRDASESRVPSRASLGLDDAAKSDSASESQRTERSPKVYAENPVFEPPFWGSKIVKGFSIDEIATYINETALFRNQWQFRPEGGESDDEFKERIRPTLRSQLAEAKAANLLEPQIVYGYFPANGDGNDLVIWSDPDRTSEVARFNYPRQTTDPFLCISDFFRPIDGDQTDVAAFHIVTMGSSISDETARLFDDDAYQQYLLTHGLGVEMTEALAEMWHQRIRSEWGFGEEDGPNLADLFRQRFRGGRYSWGYPACPDLEDNLKVAELLQADRLGVEISEETGYQYQPEQTTSALICHHPQAKYFVAR